MREKRDGRFAPRIATKDRIIVYYNSFANDRRYIVDLGFTVLIRQWKRRESD